MRKAYPGSTTLLSNLDLNPLLLILSLIPGIQVPLLLASLLDPPPATQSCSLWQPGIPSPVLRVMGVEPAERRL